jgi:hypothetical protein
MFLIIFLMGADVLPGKPLPVKYSENRAEVLAMVDNYRAVNTIEKPWYYTCIGSDRGEMGFGSYQISLSDEYAQINVQNGWAGVWTSLIHSMQSSDDIDPNRLFGPYVDDAYQSRLQGLEIDIADGNGLLKIEIKQLDGSLVYTKTIQLSGGVQTVKIPLSFPEGKRIKCLNYLMDGAGFVKIDEVRFLIDIPELSIAQKVFLYSYGHLCQCFDENSGFVADRAHWPACDFSSIQTMGTFSLATTLANDLGFVSAENAKNIINKTTAAILNKIPRFKGVLPHFVTIDASGQGHIVANTEWSSIDTIICLVSQILACQSMGISTGELEAMMQAIDWDDLTNQGTTSIGMGYSEMGNKLNSYWDTFGSEAFLAAIGYAAATGKADIWLDQFNHPPTWDGSGFNDELAALFLPMNQSDLWHNSWSIYRQNAFDKQVNYFLGHFYQSLGIFGLSAGEVPEPWIVNESDVYHAFGVGGHNQQPNDGAAVTGYPVLTPHYAAMISADHPVAFQTLFAWLINEKQIFTPLNNVESFGIDNQSVLHWNPLKGSWNLSLQLLGVARLLSDNNYLPYQQLQTNSFLKNGYDTIMANRQSSLVGSWPDLGIWSYGLILNNWIRLSKSEAFKLILADRLGNGQDDLYCWFKNDFWNEIWLQDDQGIWKKQNINCQSLIDFEIIDFNHDHLADFIGSFNGIGLWMRDEKNQSWQRLSRLTPLKITAGDFNKDGKNDLLTVFESDIWTYYGNGSWEKQPINPKNLIAIASGNMNEDEFCDIIGIWDTGIWWRDSISKIWEKLSSNPANYVIAGDMEGDGLEDLIFNWSNLGVWSRNSRSGLWKQISKQPVSTLSQGYW